MKEIIITPKQYNRRILAIENNLQKSTSMTMKKIDECIVMIVDNKVVINNDKYKQLRNLCLTEDFVNNYQKYFSNTKFITTIK